MGKRSRFSDGARGAGVSKWAYRLLPILLFFLGFAPRLVAIGRYVTPDEPTWVYRSIQFREALLAGDWAGTLVAGHPGVTTTWLGALGLSVQLSASPEWREAYTWLTSMAFLTPDNVEAFKRLAIFLSGGRVAVALVNSLGIVGIYLLARKLWGTRVALLAGLLLAFDPFLLGLSGLLHVDGLSATFVTLSLLATAIGLRPSDPEGSSGRAGKWMALSGALAGLAVLSKTPALLLLPVTGLAFCWPVIRDRHSSLRGRMARLLLDAVVWGTVFIITIALLFPAVWASPAAVLAIVSGSANRHLDEALRETFFLNRAAYDHGPLFYPVVLLWRLSPVVWLGLVPTFLRIRERRKTGLSVRPRDFPILLLVMWAILFVIAITPAAKKFDRYILPIVPSLLILAAIVWSGFSIRRWESGRWIAIGVISAQLIYLAYFVAYPLLAYNPLVGGPRTAALVLPVGWGESISAAGTYLSLAQAKADQTRAMAGIAPSLAPFYAGQTLIAGLDDPATANFVIVTIGGRQLDPTGFTSQTAGLDLIHTFHYGGLDQAWVYEVSSPQPPAAPQTLPAPVSFGDRVAMTAYSQTVSGDLVELSVNWQRLTSLAADERFTLRIAISDSPGNVWASQETELLNEVYFYPPDWVDADTGIVRYQLELPPGIPPSTYGVTLSLIDNRTGGQLPVRVGEGSFQGVVYEAGNVIIIPPESIVSASRMQIQNGSGAIWLDNRLQLLGLGDIATEALAGSRLPVDLFWHAPLGTLPDNIMIAWHLIASDGHDQVISTETLSRFETGMWRTGETIHEKYQVPLPPGLIPGRYTIAVEPLLADGQSIGLPAPLVDLQINNIDRQYELPDDVPVTFQVDWEPLTLLGVGPEEISASPGQTHDLVLYWQKREPHGEVYSVFVHVVDDNGNILLQADHWPGGLPTDILDGGQVVVDRVPLSLPANLAPGRYDIRVGLYLSEGGVRLPITGGESVTDLIGSDSTKLPVILRVTTP